MIKKQPEFQLQVAVCRYLSYNYSEILFLSDTIASLKLTPAHPSQPMPTNGWRSVGGPALD